MSKKLSAKEVESILYPRKRFEDKVVELVEEATNIEIGEGIVFEIKDVVGDTKNIHHTVFISTPEPINQCSHLKLELFLTNKA